MLALDATYAQRMAAMRAEAVASIFPELGAPASPEKREYAQRRANETGRAYLVSAAGNVLADYPENRALAENECGGVVFVAEPVRKGDGK